MSDLRTNWKVLNQATVDQAAEATAPLAYGATWASAAQNYALKPTAAKEIPLECRYLDIIFIVADTENDDVSAILWTWDGNGPAFDAVVFDNIVAGASVCTYNPVTGAALTDFFFADTISTSVENCDMKIYANTADGVAYCRIDVFGKHTMYMGYDTNAGTGGVPGTDCLSIYKFID